ncbi:7-cyano-7-deazaguanine/7-aminomethyl-7-deazaguanine transporter [Lampropedia aestuarii]|uniref:Probable queuosine precursor transporter n=1 Tax=Lampropedia aestuarii TaxID=2562762 RepID=A0A4S5BJY9_9BURK|nr:7-cyano-7-deazaguanine/7-aminomethyl-7-deazaguanine transporter [Lampropedia aestuarii]MDH5857184.1 7-cyano-7-deazaguanine/7-aminomethyl-7-deazaguanine transporter [Lampropedia aestuarii]THJ32804.1 7-cyano-7-deazaguanine/7-aminomethyl-7-deazaguanine transporter [Lampropedia aestuarii]
MTPIQSPAQGPVARVPLFLAILVVFHILIIIASNYLVQIPINLLGFHSTWGAFSFPFIFLATDLTVRLIGKHEARVVIGRVMVPALVASYIVSVLFHEGRFNGFASLAEFNGFVFRIAFASFAAYVLGQLLDIQVFDRIRRGWAAWWLAPAAASVFGQALDTAAFFGIAFWRSSDPFMAANWMEIATVDYVIKLVISLVLFVPAYGVALAAIVRMVDKPANAPVVKV